MSATTAIPASTTMSAAATSASASSSAHILRLNHKQLIVSLHGRRKSISASSSSFFSTYRFNSSISRSSRRISYPSSIRIRPLSPVMEWQDVTVKMEVDVPISVAYKCYSDREAIPEWMPFISTVKILEDKPDLSRWSLKYNAFGQNIEYSCLLEICSLRQTRRSTGDLWRDFPTGELCDFFPKAHHPVS